MNLKALLEDRISQALTAAGAPVGSPGLVMQSGRPEFGDYQANGVMAAAKQLKINPRELAQKVVDAATLDDIAESLEIAGPGFINIKLKADFLAASASDALTDEHMGVESPAKVETVVVDYSSPNLAKEMHVGHLRSTIIGDTLARVSDFIGHNVIRQNHVGDWGTQFGMLITHLQDETLAKGKALDDQGLDASFHVSIPDMEVFYIQSKKRFDDDPEFAKRARENVVKLQSGDPDINRDWDYIVCESINHCRAAYKRLGVKLTDSDIRGESFYNDDLPQVLADLESAGRLKKSEGAQCVFPKGFKNKDGEPLPVIVQKSDGGYLYATTDLAAMRYRTSELKADRILYVTDSRQALHFKQVFAVANEAGFVDKKVSLEHVPFGMMMGADNRPFKTRTGGTVKLMDLLDEAETRALALVSEKNPDLSDEDKQQIANVVGIGSVKYADLSHNRNSDYVFSWDKMLSFEGNTAPYMQYAFARIFSIIKKAEAMGCDWKDSEIAISDPAERTLAVKLAQFSETIDSVAAECLPHLLCNYLFELAGAFMSFYENCPVLKSDDATKSSRLTLCALTGRTIETGLDLLGIETIEQM